MAVDQSSSSFHQLPPYLQPYNYPTSSQAFETYSGDMARRCQSLSPPLPSEEYGRQYAPLALPPSLCPPPHLFRPIDFNTPSDNGNQLIRRSQLPTPPHSESGSASPASTGGTQSIIGKDADYTSNGITASLLEADLWSSFNSVGNEMIVTKPGRRLFPSLLVSLRGLDPQTEYNISLKVTPADHYRYKFISMRWVAIGESEVLHDEERQVYKHPNSPKSGYFWMKKPISFKPCKITHNPRSKHGNILVHTMHKYVMEIVVLPVDSEEEATTIRLKATEFVAVSAYQNTALTQLKIDNNPFAKGFRDRDIMPSAFSHHPVYSKPPMWDQGLPMPSLPGIIPEFEMTPDPSSESPSPTSSTSIPDSHHPLPDYSKPLRLPYSYPLPYPMPPPLVNLQL